MKKWSRFLDHVQKDIILWGAIVLLMLAFRAFFIFFYRANMEQGSGFSDVVWTFFSGIRFDIKTATSLILLQALVSVLAVLSGRHGLADRFRLGYGAVLVVLSITACVVTIGYFREYHDQFNHFIVNVYYDDRAAIARTIWNAYHPLRNMLIIAVLSTGAILLLWPYLRGGFPGRERLAGLSAGPASKAAVSFFLIMALAAGSRGSVDREPLRHRDAAITRDDFLNKATVNPLIALFYAVDEYQKFSGTVGVEVYLPDRDVRTAAEEVFGIPEPYEDLDRYFQKHARGPRNAQPRQVILILMESYDAWPLLPAYASLGLTEQLKAIGREGLWFQRFLPASDSTMQSLSAIITSFPYVSVEINYQQASRSAYPSSLPDAFRRLGFRTRLFYGGYLSWQRIGDFSQAQGFDEVYGGPDMGGWRHSNEWGVEDEALFAFAERMIDDSAPSFDMILTTSYHPPYDMDVWKKGFPLRQAPAGMAALMDNDVTLKMLGHLWYQDACIGAFVRHMERRFPGVLFAFTGDHYGRKFVNSRPTFFERSAVPFILYGKEALAGVTLPPGVAGSHLDIGATLIGLAAPKGFTYYSMGDDLLGSHRRNVGIGWWKMVGPDYLYDAQAETFQPLPGRDLPAVLPEPSELQTLLHHYYGIGWWRVKRGDRL